MSDTIATKAAAQACDTTPRTLRVFLRASKDYEAVGSGSRYAFTANDLPELKTRFTAWLAEREAEAQAKEKAAKEVQDKAEAKITESQDDDLNADDVDEEPEDDDTDDEEKPAPRKRAPRKVAA